MKLNLAGGIVAAILLVALILAYGALFTVYQTRQALVVRLGKPLRVEAEPGLHVKMPLVDSVIYVDKRILDIENSSQEILASDSKPLIVMICAALAATVIVLGIMWTTNTRYDGASDRPVAEQPQRQ